jgi:hypothetical protein
MGNWEDPDYYCAHVLRLAGPGPDRMANVKELDVVMLTIDLPEDGLSAGAAGTIVHIYRTPRTAYEVEFSDADGATIVSLTADQVRPPIP